MPGKAARLIITERQQAILRDMTVSRSCPQGLALRAGMILGAFERKLKSEIAEALDCERHAVGVWRRRWKAGFEKLIHAECLGRPGELRRMIATVLGDDPRPGRRSRFDPDQIALIVALACEPPEKSGRPISDGTTAELADEAVKRGIVPAISARHVGRFLKDGRAPAASEPLLAEREGQGHAGIPTAGAGGLRDVSEGAGTPENRGNSHGLRG